MQILRQSLLLSLRSFIHLVKSDLCGRTLAKANGSAANLRIRILDARGQQSKFFQLLFDVWQAGVGNLLQMPQVELEESVEFEPLLGLLQCFIVDIRDSRGLMLLC